MHPLSDRNVLPLAPPPPQSEEVDSPNVVCHNSTYRFAPKSLGLFQLDSRPRRAAIQVVTHPWFEAGIMLCIVANTTILALADYSAVHGDYTLDRASFRNDLVWHAEWAFGAVFAAECLTKVRATARRRSGRR